VKLRLDSPDLTLTLTINRSAGFVSGLTDDRCGNSKCSQSAVVDLRNRSRQRHREEVDLVCERRAYRAEVTSLAARYRLPAIYPFRQFTEVGGLLSYGNDMTDNHRRAATYVDRILKGAEPSELPVQAPVKFEMAINLKTAKALGLNIPEKLLVFADEVIE
jgi:hypothetical protein